MNPVGDTFCGGFFPKIREESGTVEIENVHDAVLNVVRYTRRGENSEIAALGMADDRERPREFRSGGAEIREGVCLGGNGVFNSHQEVLLPAGDGVICAAEDDYDLPVGQGDGECRKLFGLFFVELPAIIR